MSALYLIDGNSYLYRAFYAIRGLSASDGTPTNAIFGFSNMILKILREKHPDYFGVVFDSPGPTHRHEAYQEYKAHRPGMPDDLKPQVPLVKEIIKAFGIMTIEKAGYEADDILAHIARMAASDGIDVYIVTGDKDMCQVVSPKIKLYDTMKERITEEKDVIERFGVSPSRFPEVIALMGDSSDNIPGAPGIGEKTAVKLLREFETLDNLIINRERIKNARARNAVSDNIDSIKLSRELATVHPDVPVDVAVKDFVLKEPEWTKLIEYFRKYEFSSLIKLVPAQASHSGGKTEFITVLDNEQLEEALAEVRTAVTIDTETTTSSPMNAELVGISLSADPERAYYIPVGHAYLGAPVQLQKRLVLDRMKAILEDEKILKTGHNIKYDIIVLRNEGINVRGVDFDTMLASYLLNPNNSNHNLTDTAMEYLGIKKRSYSDVAGKGVKDFSEVSVEDASSY
ncbi:MAG: 5'-3' exonuclease H3TH domain-containing protein, partial [Nitrospirota bacterium]